MEYYALQKDVFDISKVTVVGTPTITSDGVASGFSANNYIQQNIQAIGENPFKICFSFSTSSFSETQALLGYAYNVYNTVRLNTAKRLVIPMRFSDSSLYNLTSDALLENTNYDAFFEFTGAKYILAWKLSTSNSYTSVSFDSPLFLENKEATLFRIGFVSSLNAQYSKIYLNNVKIYVDNQLVFQPVKPTYLLERRKEGYDPSKFTVVGSPTITEYGVASGFSGSNFIRVPITMQNAWKIQMKATFTNIEDMLSPLFNISNYNRIILGANRTITIFASEDNATAKSINFNNIVLSINKDYLLTFEFDGVSTYTFTAKDLNTNTEYNQSVILNSKFYNSASHWAIGSDASRYVRGSIDLPSFSITVDGKEVFTGAKENYYMLRR